MPFTANEVNSKCIRNYDFIQRNSTDINACHLWSKMFDLVRKDVKETIDTEADVYKGEVFMSAAVYISGLLDLELKDHLKRDRYERSAEDDPNYRNGSYNRRFCMKSVGDTNITVPRDRKGTYKPKALPRFQRYEIRKQAIIKAKPLCLPECIKEDLT